MEPAVILIGIAGLISVGLLIQGWKTGIDSANNWAKLLQAIFTFCALSLAAYWYFVERKGLPHADVTQTIVARVLDDDVLAIEAHIKIENIGERLLTIREIQSHLQDVEGATYNYASLARMEDNQYWRAQRPARLDDNHFNGAELRWPVVRAFNDQVEHHIEPGETDLLVITFLFQCAEVSDHVRVATDVLNPQFGSERRAWKARDFVDLRDTCPLREGERR